MHGLRFEYERDGEQVIVIARAEDDNGETWVARQPVTVAPTLATDADPVEWGRRRAAEALQRGMPT